MPRHRRHRRRALAGPRRLLSFTRDGLASRWVVGDAEVALEDEVVSDEVESFAREFRYRGKPGAPPAYRPDELPSTELHRFDPSAPTSRPAGRKPPSGASNLRRSRDYEVHFGRSYAIGFRGQRIRTWNLATGKVLRTVSARGNVPPERVLLRGDESEVAFGEARYDSSKIASLPSLEIESVPPSGFVRGHVEEPVPHRSPRFLIDRSAYTGPLFEPVR